MAARRKKKKNKRTKRTRSSKRTSNARLHVLRIALLCAFGGLAARGLQLTVFPDERLESLAERQYNTSLHLAPRRGAIQDRNGDVLAASVDVASIYVNPRQFNAQVPAPSKLKTTRALARVLGLPQESVKESLKKDRAFVWLKRQVDPDEAKRVAALEIPGVEAVQESKRFYPHVELAAHMIGFAGVDMEGLEGVENKYNQVLRAEGQRFVRPRDARGRTYSDGLFVSSDTTGHDVQLTIDSRIQYLTELALRRGVVAARAKAGYAIVQEPHTGRILALAVQPTFNPNAFKRHQASHWRNRAIADVIEPGSTLKVLVMAAALDAGAIDTEQIFFCEKGSIEVADRVITDPKKHGWLDPARILQFSSNIGMIKIARELGRERLSKRLVDFGFGKATGLDLPGESPGILPPSSRWNSVRLATVAFGQGIGVTGIQLTSSVSAIANGGTLMRPYVVEKVIAADGRALVDRQPTVMRRVIRQETAATVTQMMERVTQAGGTGGAAALPRWRVAGKTGTAQKPDLVAGGYSHDKRTASFVGFAPASDPKLTILVVIDEPQTSVYGGAVAAPVFKEIADGTLRYLQVPADRAPGSAVAAVSRDAVIEGTIASRARALARVSAQAALARASKAEPGTMPDFAGLSMRSALRTAQPRQVHVEVHGHGVAVRQRPAPGTRLQPGDKVQLWFKEKR